MRVDGVPDVKSPWSDMTVAILAGGLGTRLRPVVADRPKPLAPVEGRPFLCYLFDALRDVGVAEVVLLAGFRAAQMRDELGEQYGTLRLRYSVEPTPLGTAGAIRHALPELRHSTLLLLNGDSFCDVDFHTFHASHIERRVGVSMVISSVEDTTPFGRVDLDADGRVARFEEKGRRSGPGWVNAGVYLMDREVVAELPAGQMLSLERDVLPARVSAGDVWGFPADGSFLDIGTPEVYQSAAAFFAGR
jgi:D-glycero-alpha-D-manno-heptose 1-phosphate guanylyltransferase